MGSTWPVSTDESQTILREKAGRREQGTAIYRHVAPPVIPPTERPKPAQGNLVTAFAQGSSQFSWAIVASITMTKASFRPFPREVQGKIEHAFDHVFQMVTPARGDVLGGICGVRLGHRLTPSNHRTPHRFIKQNDVSTRYLTGARCGQPEPGPRTLINQPAAQS